MNVERRRADAILRRAADFGGILVIAVIIGSFSRGARVSPLPFGSPAETITWYCAGEAVNRGADPYRVEPLRSCEIAHHAIRPPQWVEPAPLPGYTFAAFSVFARLPFAVAQTLLVYGLTGVVVATALILARLTRTPSLLPLLCLAPLDGYINIFYRELPPIAIFALVGAAALGSFGRYRSAAACAGIAMIEPHVGLPGCLAMFIWWPQTRVPFAFVAAILASLSIGSIGIFGNIEYFTTVLSVHAASELPAVDQYSLAHLLHLFGVSDRSALRIGTASYVLMTILGVYFARSLATAAEAESLITLFPPAVAMLGGVFVHDIQIAAAIPAAIIIGIWQKPPVIARSVALIGILFTWQAWYWLRSPQIFPLEIGAVAAGLLLVMRNEPPRVRYAATVIGSIVCTAIAILITYVPTQRVGPPTRIAVQATPRSDLASANWAQSVRHDARYSTSSLRDIAEKIPIWLGLSTLAATGIRYSRTGRRHGLPE